MIFWDTTSTYFEGKGPAELAHYGYSKDHRPDRLQVMIGVVMTQAGIPIAHEVFPGNTPDSMTFKQIIADLRKRFNLGRVFFVDRDMVSKEILDELDRNHTEYIVGMRMHKAKEVGEVLKTGGKYKVVRDKLRVKEVRYDANRYIIYYNPLQAEYDKKAREEMVAKLESQLKSYGVKSLVGNSGYRHYPWCWIKMQSSVLTGSFRKEKPAITVSMYFALIPSLTQPRQPWLTKTCGG